MQLCIPLGRRDLRVRLDRDVLLAADRVVPLEEAAVEMARHLGCRQFNVHVEPADRKHGEVDLVRGLVHLAGERVVEHIRARPLPRKTQALAPH